MSALRGQTPATSLPGGPHPLVPPACSPPPPTGPPTARVFSRHPSLLITRPTAGRRTDGHWRARLRVWGDTAQSGSAGHLCPRRAAPVPTAPTVPGCHGLGEPTHPVTTCPHLLPCFQPAGVTLVSVHCSPDDQTLWALDSRWNVHVRAGITEEMPVGTDWEHVPGSDACPAVATQGLSDRRQRVSAPVLPGWGPHQQSTASRPLGFTAGRSFPNGQGLWSDAHSRHLLC